METSVNSMMPEGLMNGLEEPEIRDLFLYLRQARDPEAAAAATPSSTSMTDERLAAYRKELERFRSDFGGSRDLPDIRFFLFGMGQRAKLIYRDGKLLDPRDGKILHDWKQTSDLIVPSAYEVVLRTADGMKVTITEDEEAVWIMQDGRRTAIEGTRSPVKLPSFSDKKYPGILHFAGQ